MTAGGALRGDNDDACRRQLPAYGVAVPCTGVARGDVPTAFKRMDVQVIAAREA
ncbi:hypothetical protein [Stenotrophomonas sp. 24(2023)]|uniref:hypothetical protein n=1 Tax=Stenotrophomonas sp. 24(2023) TaxID=3068324 RepID=UPI0027DF0EBE|nr:hypothetical protein [Stenotrophomonas sp. 24(2023)]WMJ71217.1 hypothetical protein Q9R17_09030 [Stenotrophomonas sp. 24(2023)]